MQTPNPTISVIMSVYNAEKYLRESIESILNQTFKDFEFIIIDDGSTDRSKEIILSFKDPRIKLVSRENRGLTKSLNEAIKQSVGKYIARMDADDISEKDRFEKQINFLETNPDIYLCGTWARSIDESGAILGELKYPPQTSDEIKKYLIRHNPFIHSTVMFKKGLVDKVGFYDEKFLHVEDYELWTRVVPKFKTANMPEFLLRYRKAEAGVTGTKKPLMRLKGVFVRILAVFRLMML